MINKFIPCRRCASLSIVSKPEGISKPEGYVYVALENGQVAIQECPCHTEWRLKSLLEIKARKANLWCDEENLSYSPASKYVGKNSLSNVKKLEVFVERFEDPKYKKSSLYLYGPYGTQKTHLAQWMGLSLLKKNFSVYYLPMQQLVSNLSSEFDSSIEKQEKIEYLLSVDCIILDECFDRKKVTLYKSGYQLPFLETFLRERMEHRQKSIIFISNSPIEDINSQGFGDSIQNFVERNIVPHGASLLFNDNYHAAATDVDIDKLFED